MNIYMRWMTPEAVVKGAEVVREFIESYKLKSFQFSDQVINKIYCISYYPGIFKISNLN